MNNPIANLAYAMNNPIKHSLQINFNFDIEYNDDFEFVKKVRLAMADSDRFTLNYGNRNYEFVNFDQFLSDKSDNESWEDFFYNNEILVIKWFKYHNEDWLITV